MTPDFAGRTALLIAHPGHELGVHGWMEKTHPAVNVLTDGSGGDAVARTASSERVIRGAGARPGRIFGRWADREIYGAFLAHDHALFLKAATEIADMLVEERIDFFFCETMEGYCSTHDVCRLLACAAVLQASERHGHAVRCFEFPLLARGLASATGSTPLRIILDDAALARKVAAARSYPELANEVEAALNMGVEIFRVESFWPFDPAAPIAVFQETPFYERHGDRMVAEGRYENTIRYREHFLPLVAALGGRVDADSR